VTYHRSDDGTKLLLTGGNTYGTCFPLLYQLPKAIRLSSVREKETLSSQGGGGVGAAVA